jgi:hypothetical protein
MTPAYGRFAESPARVSASVSFDPETAPKLTFALVKAARWLSHAVFVLA